VRAYERTSNTLFLFSFLSLQLGPHPEPPKGRGRLIEPQLSRVQMPAATKTAKPSPRIGDAAVKAKTGQTWNEWFKILDAAGGKTMNHQQLVARLGRQHGIGPWWQQMIAVTYEQARGLREKHEKPGGYEISVSRTINAPLSRAFKAWTDEKARKKWLPSNFKVRKATTNKSLRITWEDEKTSVAVAFLPKGSGKCQVVAQHSKLSNANTAAKMKTFWAQALDRLKELIE
jgi:uncharacterized protein YndB with AHSA1/START domain